MHVYPNVHLSTHVAQSSILTQDICSAHRQLVHLVCEGDQLLLATHPGGEVPRITAGLMLLYSFRQEHQSSLATGYSSPERPMGCPSLHPAQGALLFTVYGLQFFIHQAAALAFHCQH